MDQNLTLYKIFYNTALAGNISKAADELYISQPAISKAVKRLEENLKVTLFTRSSRGVSLTEEGKILFDHLQTAFTAIQTGEDSLRQINDLCIGHIRIGVSSTLCKFLLIPYLKEFIRLYPHIKVTIECQSSQHTLRLLKENKIDLGLVGMSEPLSNIHFDSLGTIQDTFVATKTYLNNLKLREGNQEEDVFRAANLMLLDRENMSRLYIDHYLNVNSIVPNQILEVSDMDLLIEFARIGMGISCVIREFVKEDIEQGRLIEIPLSIPVKEREAGFVYRNSTSLSRSTNQFIEFYKSVNNKKTPSS